MTPDKPFTVSALADRWGVSTTFIYNMLNSGTLEGIKLGAKLWRIKPEVVERYENATLDGPPPNPLPPP